MFKYFKTLIKAIHLPEEKFLAFQEGACSGHCPYNPLDYNRVLAPFGALALINACISRGSLHSFESQAILIITCISSGSMHCLVLKP